MATTTAGPTATGAGTKIDVTLKLSQLQNLVKRDPVGYQEDYQAQVRRLESECGILGLSGGSGGGNGGGGGMLHSNASLVTELIQFAAATSSSSYKGQESDRIANLLIGLLVGGNSAGTGENDDNDDDDTSSTSFLKIDTVSESTSSTMVVGPQTKNASAKKQNTNHNSNNYNRNVHLQMTMPTSALQLPRDVRKACVSALILMRNKGALQPLHLLELFFRLMAVVPDKALRELLYGHMVHDIRNINKKGKRDDKVNRAIQSFLHRVVATHGQQQQQQQQHAGVDGTDNNNNTEESATDMAAKRATDMVCELYRRQVWNDDRTVAILASACQSRNTTVMARAMRFFLNIEEKMADDQRQQEEEVWDASQKIDFHRFSRKTKHRQRHVERQVANRHRQQRKREGTNVDEWMDVRDDQGVEASRKLYPALELLRDPQGLAEAVLRRLKQPKSIPYRIKLLMMNFCTRLVGNHELMLLNVYPFLQKYMGGQQRDVTAVLAYTVQACHEHVPPDEVYGILKTIAHNFVTERCSEEQMAVGINAIRAICARVPAVLSVEEDSTATTAAGEGGLTTTTTTTTTTTANHLDVEAFVRDIAAYSNHRDRSVSIAGKAFTNFIRETHPSLLQGKDRGLKGSALHKAKAKPMRYGEQKINYGVDGADLLVEYEAKKAAFLKKQEQQQSQGDDEDEDDEEFDEEEEVIESDNDEEAPDLIVLDPNNVEEQASGEREENEHQEEDAEVLNLSKLTPEERNKIKQEVSSNRVFSAADFVKMRKLVEREERARRDPREAARRKRAVARGQEFEELSEDDSDGDGDDEDDHVRISGAVDPTDIMADAKRKRQSKAQKLEKVLAGREAFETKARAGGSTNTEKQRKKNFLMTKSSKSARSKGRGKGALSVKRGHGGKAQMGHEAKKRRRRS